MKLKVKIRLAETKKIVNDIRREGNIPAILYAKDHPNKLIEVVGPEFKAHLRAIPQGGLPNTIFTLEDEEGKVFKALVKDIQYHVSTYEILHLDFIYLLEDTPVNVKIPLRFKGVADCVGVKLGGVVRPVIRHLKVRCLPKHIPTEFNLNVSKLSINQSMRLSKIELSEKIKPLLDLNEVAVVIAKR
ncbi:MAG: General stress protein CTC [Chlamydiae bacterium]|nr:General stress protein CTC [Chlamydiota bacterium]